MFFLSEMEPSHVIFSSNTRKKNHKKIKSPAIYNFNIYKDINNFKDTIIGKYFLRRLFIFFKNIYFKTEKSNNLIYLCIYIFYFLLGIYSKRDSFKKYGLFFFEIDISGKVVV